MGEEAFPRPEDEQQQVDHQQGWDETSGQPHAEIPAHPDGTFVSETLGDVALPVDEPEAEPAEPTQEIEPSADNDENGGRWDEQKARTMASVVHNDRPHVQNSLANLLELQQTNVNVAFNDDGTPNTDYKDFQTSHAHIDVRNAKKALDIAIEEGDEEAVARYTESLEALQAKYEATKAAQAERLAKDARDDGDRIDRASDKLLQPFEQLYDANPSKYAEMPTSEFVELVKTFESLADKIERLQDPSEQFRPILQRIEKSLEMERDCLTQLDTWHLENKLWALGDSDSETWNELLPDPDITVEGTLVNKAILAQLRKWENNFDMSPRQVFEAKANLVRAALAKGDEKIAEYERQRQEMLG